MVSRITGGAGVGEEVSRDVIRDFRRKSDKQLRFLRGRGLSDQRVALIDTILDERRTGRQFSERDLVRGFSESRGFEILEDQSEQKERIFQGPVRPTTSEETFRATGRSVPKAQGPVRPGFDESAFRRTGVSSRIKTPDFLRKQIQPAVASEGNFVSASDIRKRGFGAGRELVKTDDGRFGFISEDRKKIEIVTPKDRSAERALLRKVSGFGASRFLKVEPDLAFEKFSDFTEKQLDQLGIPQDSILREKFNLFITPGDLVFTTFFFRVAESGASKKGTAKAQVVEKTSKKAKEKVTAKDLRKALEKLSREDLNKQVRSAVNRIRSSKLTKSQKEEALIKVEALVREATTKERFITESGKVDAVKLLKARQQLPIKRSKTGVETSRKSIDFLTKKTPSLKGSSFPTAKVVDLGDAPKIVTGQSQRTGGAFTGTGKFEKTSETRAVTKSPTQQQREIFQNKVDVLRTNLQNQGLSSSQISKQLFKQKSLLNQQSKLDSLQRQLQKNSQATAQTQVQKQIQKQKQKQLQKQIQLQRQRIQQRQKLNQKSRLRGRGRFRGRGRPRPKIPRLPLIDFTFKKKIKPAFSRGSGKSQGYNVFTGKGKKTKKINQNPLSLKQADSLGSYVVDHSLAGSFRTKKTNKLAMSSAFKFPRNYARRVSFKFRPGKNNPKLKVEKRTYRLDTLRERKKIQVARLLARIRKGKPVKKVKFKKLPKSQFKKKKN